MRRFWREKRFFVFFRARRHALAKHNAEWLAKAQGVFLPGVLLLSVNTSLPLYVSFFFFFLLIPLLPYISGKQIAL